MSLTFPLSRLAGKINQFFTRFFQTAKNYGLRQSRRSKSLISDYLRQAPPPQLTRISFVCLLPAGLFWVGMAIYLLKRNTIILDLLFSNYFLGYLTVIGLPIAAGFLSLLSWRRQRSRWNGIGLFLAGLSLLLLLVMIAWP